MGEITATPDCVFCHIIETETWTLDLDECVGIAPRNPVTPGHMLIVPRYHVTDALDWPLITAETFRTAAEYVKFHLAAPLSAMNLITSVGVDATQTVFHLHVHVVPRQAGDGLHLPWTGQVK